jgi:SHS2 domain-containing protein
VPPGHELLNHTADVALRAWGSTVRDVFEQAALAMCGLMYDPAAVEPLETVRVELEAPDDEMLLAAWLNELLYLVEAESFLACRFRVDEAGPAGVARAGRGAWLRAAVAGERDTAGRHSVRAVVKAATLHELWIRPKDAGWEGHVLLDV